MKPLLWDAINPITGTPFTWDDPNLFWGDPSHYLEPGDPGFVPYPQTPTPTPTHKPKRKYMASNPTPDRYDELVAAGEDLYDGLVQHAAALGITQNTPAKFRLDLDALIAAHAVLKNAEGAQVAPAAALRTADSNGKGFIAKALNVLRISLGTKWTDAWAPTGLPDNAVAVPSTQDCRFTALLGLKNYFTANPAMENAALGVTGALAAAFHTTLSDARNAAANAKTAVRTASMAHTQKKDLFRERFRGTIEELDKRMDDDDPRWYDFGLNRPGDPKTPGVPENVDATALGTGRVLVTLTGARRANSFNYYKQQDGTDPEPVKLGNFPDTQRTFEDLPPGATLAITVRGVNDAGEGPASPPDTVVVS